MKLNLDKVTLIAFENGDLNKMIPALKMCLHYCNFGAVKLLSCFDMSNVDIDCEKIPVKHTTYEEYNRFMLEDCGDGIGFVGDYVDTEYMLFIHWDGFILNPNSWTDEFYNYDYIGAAWTCWGFPEHLCVGNGGFTLRSKKLLNFIKNDHNIKFQPEHTPYGIFNAEDSILCVKHGEYLMSNGFNFAPIQIANLFSVESKPWQQSFGAHFIHRGTDISMWKDYNIYTEFSAL